MRRWKALATALGLTVVAVAGSFYLRAPSGAKVATPGRYRDGRGRAGREGPPATYVCTWPISIAYKVNSFTDGANGVAAPTNNGDIQGPDCSFTSSDLTFPATAGGQYSVKYTGFPPVGKTAAFWARAHTGTATIDIVDQGNAGAFQRCAVTINWTRCSYPTNTTGSNFFIGHASNYTGAATSIERVYIAGLEFSP